VLIANTATAATYQAKSASHPVGLIELYTSQGCSSCPPAEKWLGELEQRGIDQNKAIPLALHVDYWDYIGWKDRFAQKYFKERQYRYRKLGHSPSVYTPQILFNGKDVRRVSAFNNYFNEFKKAKAAVDFTVVAKERDERVLDVAIDFSRIDDEAKNSNLIVVLAESELVHDILSGENAGRKLKHQHVARQWKNLGKVKDRLNTTVVLKEDWVKENVKLLLIVETPDMQTQQVLQFALK